MIDQFFREDVRRDPFPLYARARAETPLLRDAQSGLWMVFDYEGVKRVLSRHEAFSSAHGPDWMTFTDPPRHTKLRGLVSRAFTPRSVAALEPRIRAIAGALLDATAGRGAMDLAADFAFPLPMRVIAEMLGVNGQADGARFARRNNVLLEMSYTIPGGPGSEEKVNDFLDATAEMSEYPSALLARRRSDPAADDLLARLASAEVEGERLTHAEITGFFQLLLLAGSETTTNLINSAMLCFIEHPDQLARLRAEPALLPSAIEEVLRYRSPLQWMYRITKRDTELHGQTIPAGRMVLAMIGSANHDAGVFPDADRFDVTRDPNPHLAFGHGVHFCLGAPLARLEASIALAELLRRADDFRLASDEPWTPRRGLHVHGPASLPIQVRALR